MNLDAEYCREMDPDGTPIRIYEMYDFVYQCAGHWRENARSYMITFDRDEPFQKFRCWVYERRDLFTIYLSRSIGSACGFNQTSSSYLPEDGADLWLELQENERIRKFPPSPSLSTRISSTYKNKYPFNRRRLPHQIRRRPKSVPRNRRLSILLRLFAAAHINESSLLRLFIRHFHEIIILILVYIGLLNHIILGLLYNNVFISTSNLLYYY